MEKKFRFWSKQQKKFVYPHIWVQSNNVLSANEGEGEDIIIQQWTGLQDKNKKDIYEGDIVKSSERIGNKIGEVSFGDFSLDMYSACGWHIKNEGWDAFNSNLANGDVEIIGNILENSEILNN